MDLDLPPPERRVYCNRTLNLRSIGCIGFDMDYTLVHYDTEVWERRAYEHARGRLAESGLPVGDLTFDPGAFTRGLILDLKLGNVVKANRFGYVKRASHGSRMLTFDEQRDAYARTFVDLRESRWRFLNTLFSLSEACLFAQLVDLMDRGALPVRTPAELYDDVQDQLGWTHMESELKAEIVNDPDRFVVLDPDLPLALRDLREAGKKLLIITNSEWSYTTAMMSYAFDRYLGGGSWRELFDLVIVGARKPAFFTQDQPIFRVVDPERGLLAPHLGPLTDGGAYLGGSAAQIEAHFGLSGEEILFVGDHVFADVNVSKKLLRWRTALVIRELEAEVAALQAAHDDQARIAALMDDKERLEHAMSQLRLARLRQERGYGPPTDLDPAEIAPRIAETRERIDAIDAALGPLVAASAALTNPRWGLLFRAGNDKSHLARQVERYADVYTSRVSNLLYATPYDYLRSPRGSLPHDAMPGAAQDG